MTYEERPAPPELAGIVTRLWFLETPPLRRYEKILPLPFVHLIINLSEAYRIHDRHGAASVVPEAFVSGLQSEFLVIESPPLIRHVGIELTPMGLHALAPGAAPTAAQAVRDAGALLPGIPGLVLSLRSVTLPDAALAAADRWLRERPLHPLDDVAGAALAAIERDPETTIGALAAELGVSHQRLVARCRAAAGTTPKQYAQVLRFHRLLDAVHAEGGPPEWAALAAASGYYDQPHVVRAFRRFSGWTPTEYYRLVSEHGPDAAHFIPLEKVPASEGQARA